MQVERVKYLIRAADTQRAVAFYTSLFGATVGRSNPAVTELELLGSVIGIHSGGEGKRTWTGLSFQVPDVVAGAAEVVAAGGQLTHEPKEEDGEPPGAGARVDLGAEVVHGRSPEGAARSIVIVGGAAIAARSHSSTLASRYRSSVATRFAGNSRIETL